MSKLSPLLCQNSFASLSFFHLIGTWELYKQEEYGDDDEMGKLECGHNYHIECIKQWLVQKNSCPVCKAVAAASQN